MNKKPLRILVADDQPLFRLGIRSLFASSDQTCIVLEAETGQDVMTTLDYFPADIVMLNIHLRDPDGIQTTQLILQKFPGVKVMALSMQLESFAIRRMLNAGASGCMLKNASQTEALEALHHLLAGEIWFSPQISSELLAGLIGSAAETAAQRDPITPREREILVLICQEFTNPEIAEKLSISRRTVDTHRNNLLQKLGVKNTVGLIKYALAKGLLDA